MAGAFNICFQILKGPKNKCAVLIFFAFGIFNRIILQIFLIKFNCLITPSLTFKSTTNATMHYVVIITLL